jgi:hypothetical protein
MTRMSTYPVQRRSVADHSGKKTVGAPPVSLSHRHAQAMSCGGQPLWSSLGREWPRRRAPTRERSPSWAGYRADAVLADVVKSRGSRPTEPDLVSEHREALIYVISVRHDRATRHAALHAAGRGRVPGGHRRRPIRTVPPARPSAGSPPRRLTTVRRTLQRCSSFAARLSTAGASVESIETALVRHVRRMAATAASTQ